MGSLSQLVAALDALPCHFSAVALSEQAAEQAEAAVHLLYKAVEAADLHDIAIAWETLIEGWVHRMLCLFVGGCATDQSIQPYPCIMLQAAGCGSPQPF